MLIAGCGLLHDDRSIVDTGSGGVGVQVTQDPLRRTPVLSSVVQLVWSFLYCMIQARKHGEKRRLNTPLLVELL